VLRSHSMLILLTLLSSTAWVARQPHTGPSGSLSPRPLGRQPKLVASSAVASETIPMFPSADLSPSDVMEVICTGLEYNNWPYDDVGIERLYNFLTPQGRVALAPPPARFGRQGNVTLEDFLADASSHCLGALVLCSGFEVFDEPIITPGSQTRGRWATQKLIVHNRASDMALSSVIESEELTEAMLDAARRGAPTPAVPAMPSSMPSRMEMLCMLEEQRRPPFQGCWLLKELRHNTKSILQELNEGGEEFEGPDTE